jgi:hypothetical protein
MDARHKAGMTKPSFRLGLSRSDQNKRRRGRSDRDAGSPIVRTGVEIGVKRKQPEGENRSDGYKILKKGHAALRCEPLRSAIPEMIILCPAAKWKRYRRELLAMDKRSLICAETAGANAAPPHPHPPTQANCARRGMISSNGRSQCEPALSKKCEIQWMRSCGAFGANRPSPVKRRPMPATPAAP